jgi:ribosomal protein S18 acetylase RimI-like enzyme
MTPVEVIHLQPNQWEQYRQIRLEALLDSPQAYSTTYQQMVDKPDTFWQDRLINAAARKESWLLFARVNECIVGMIGAFLSNESNRAMIVSVYVSPVYRGQGVSRALMEAILNELRQNQAIQEVELTVTSGQEAAIALYRRFGFMVTNEEEEMMGDGRTHLGLVMQRKI